MLRHGAESHNRKTILWLLHLCLGCENGLVTVVNTQFLEHVVEVVFNGVGTDSENRGDLVVALAEAKPVKDLHFPWAQVGKTGITQ